VQAGHTVSNSGFTSLRMLAVMKDDAKFILLTFIYNNEFSVNTEFQITDNKINISLKKIIIFVTLQLYLIKCIVPISLKAAFQVFDVLITC